MTKTTDTPKPLTATDIINKLESNTVNVQANYLEQAIRDIRHSIALEQAAVLRRNQAIIKLTDLEKAAVKLFEEKKLSSDVASQIETNRQNICAVAATSGYTKETLAAVVNDALATVK